MNAGEQDADATATVDGTGAAEAHTAGLAEGSVELQLLECQRELEASQLRLREVSRAYNELKAEMKAFKERMENRARLDSEAQAYDQVKAFFEPVMNLQRSLSSAVEGAGLLQGLHMVVGQFMEALHKLGLVQVAGEGAPFDPRVHEAIAVEPVTDPAMDGKVLVVHATGFVVNGRVLHPAQVTIGKAAEPAGEA